ncbi:patatin-like phospholipase family protein [Fodinisporobacter ferrooxydans]|uniref:Patatin-like phospholipase family protein n=1 Tax=Fodinisporobacter ferrooxydans TaxID=2901836 RepID=A0ABY4CLP5_9BACL|nr:patatin-like phospholipase family protein [Alicyclobacillaceae bacterium MYW30-H2]
MRVNAVFEGGGIFAISFAGAIQALEQRGYVWDGLAGTSAGAIVAALLASGYTGEQLRQLVFELDYRRFLGEGLLYKIPFIGKWMEIWLYCGMYRNDPLEKWLGDLLAKKGVRTFSDLPAGKLKIIVSDITNGRMLVIPDDLKKYGVLEKDFPIANAVKMSSSIPFFFQPVKWKIRKRKEKIYAVDGGILSNYPIWLFDNGTLSRQPTIGFRFQGKDNDGFPKRIKGPISKLEAIFQTMLRAHDLRHIDQQDASRTILIPTGSISFTQFHLTKEDQDFLYASGYHAAEDFVRKQK